MSKERELIRAKFGGRCAYCGEPLDLIWHIDHKLPIKRRCRYKKDKNGKYLVNKHFCYIKEYYVEHPERDTFENKVPSCPSCNINKHSFSIEEFRVAIKGFMKSLNTHSVQYKVAKRYGLVTETGKEIKFFFEIY